MQLVLAKLCFGEVLKRQTTLSKDNPFLIPSIPDMGKVRPTIDQFTTILFD